MIEFQLNGRTVTTRQGDMLIEAAEAAGVYIPRFCYHKKLSVVANCRMCLVEIKNANKLLPACATPTTPGMIVDTESEAVKAAQRSIMEFLLVNHPLDCPICDQGGECELQDIAFAYGHDTSRFTEGKRSVNDKSLGALVATEMTRCIHCTRCVRFGEEIAGMRELGAMGRGEDMEIGSYVDTALQSPLSGNMIDLCPVGALTDKPYRFKVRSWEMSQSDSLSPHDCIGSNLHLHTRYLSPSKGEQVIRVVPKENEAINETWIPDRDRFSYQGLYADDRLLQPKIRQGKVWKTVEWGQAFEMIIHRFKDLIDRQGPNSIGGVISSYATTEECYLFQKLLRSLGSVHIDHRIRQMDFRDQVQAPSYMNLGVSLEALAKQNMIVLVGSDIQHAQPMGCHRIRKAARKGAKVIVINPVQFELSFSATHHYGVGLTGMVDYLARIAKALLDSSPVHQTSSPDWVEWFESIEYTQADQALADELRAVKKGVLLRGDLLWAHPQASVIRNLTAIIAELTGLTVGDLTPGPNSGGAWLAGAVPHRSSGAQTINQPGMTVREMWENPLSGYLLQGFEPAYDAAQPGLALKALEAAEWVVMLSTHQNSHMSDYADVLLPIAPFAESEGTWMNIEGRWQHFEAAYPPKGEARPAWKILRVLGHQFGLDGFDYKNLEAVWGDFQATLPDESSLSRDWQITCPTFTVDADVTEKSSQRSQILRRISYWPIYQVDGLVRRSRALNETPLFQPFCVTVNPAVAKRLRVKDREKVIVIQGDNRIIAELVLNHQVPDGHLIMAAGTIEGSIFDTVGGFIDVTKWVKINA